MAAFTLVLAVLAPPVQATCDPSPVIVAMALQHYKGWSLLTENDLGRDDRQLWRTYHGSQCPGLTALDLDGRKTPTYALALLQRGSGSVHEILLLVKGTLKTHSMVVVADEPNATGPKVLWRAPPGPAREFETGRITHVAHDAFVFEEMESTATLYYSIRGKLKSILTTD